MEKRWRTKMIVSAASLADYCVYYDSEERRFMALAKIQPTENGGLLLETVDDPEPPKERMMRKAVEAMRKGMME